ncbi:TatD family hydrolase [Bacillus sp. FJAT-50079]|uniref:TatD family hydrolase n=1 Tax=Bacillus sp. FJAT-50079 TaxID=2833577 RepID=UPI001BC9CF5F|nr:TatD family hydrolase [Bacillus sp. FJAT-50079]MBS4206509.1 TatD family hydrolase [Bacillus sp. FJAT-50079]
MKIIDAHIHLDHYEDDEITALIGSLQQSSCEKVISVSYDLQSCKRNKELAKKYKAVETAFGFHPEQELPTDEQLADLLAWMEANRDRMCAIGEIGLPYYTGKSDQTGYIELLDGFLQKAKKWKKPVVLHAVYEDAPVVCRLLEKHQIIDAHFHWFKGDQATIERMIENGYYISITPDVLYEQEIRQLVQRYPLEQMMVETDGPWQFEGEFSEEMTHPKMIHHSIAAIAELKKIDRSAVYQKLYLNTKSFYHI